MRVYGEGLRSVHVPYLLDVGVEVVGEEVRVGDLAVVGAEDAEGCSCGVGDDQRAPAGVVGVVLGFERVDHGGEAVLVRAADVLGCGVGGFEGEANGEADEIDVCVGLLLAVSSFRLIGRSDFRVYKQLMFP